MLSPLLGNTLGQVLTRSAPDLTRRDRPSSSAIASSTRACTGANLQQVLDAKVSVKGLDREATPPTPLSEKGSSSQSCSQVCGIHHLSQNAMLFFLPNLVPSHCSPGCPTTCHKRHLQSPTCSRMALFSFHTSSFESCASLSRCRLR